MNHGGPLRHSLLLACLFVSACAAPPPAASHFGVMREVMREGRTEARATLADHAKPGTVAVGALTGLAGEFVIDDGVAWVAVDTPEARLAPAGATATLLTVAPMPARRDVALGAIADVDALESAVEQALGRAPGDGDVVPFVVDGRGAVQLHVARGGCPHEANLPPERAPARWAGDDVPLRLVGFLVRGREGVMTHMGTSLHVHVLATGADGRRRTGHVEQLALAAGAVLQLPAR